MGSLMGQFSRQFLCHFARRRLAPHCALPFTVQLWGPLHRRIASRGHPASANQPSCVCAQRHAAPPAALPGLEVTLPTLQLSLVLSCGHADVAT